MAQRPSLWPCLSSPQAIGDTPERLLQSNALECWAVSVRNFKGMEQNKRIYESEWILVVMNGGERMHVC
uniref:Uncharacterized protein n=1 Tax=Panagrellus redivivus TaxID=6233 RepID=A0A7E4VHP0_PANRE